MSYDGDQIRNLGTAIRDVIPGSTRALREMLNEFGNGKLINALKENAKEQEIANLLKLCDLSMKNPQLNILTQEEMKQIMINAKEKMIGKTATKNKSR